MRHSINSARRICDAETHEWKPNVTALHRNSSAATSSILELSRARWIMNRIQMRKTKKMKNKKKQIYTKSDIIWLINFYGFQIVWRVSNIISLPSRFVSFLLLLLRLSNSVNNKRREKRQQIRSRLRFFLINLNNVSHDLHNSKRSTKRYDIFRPTTLSTFGYERNEKASKNIGTQSFLM